MARRSHLKLMLVQCGHRVFAIDFFLVTTTIETDSGINRKLPPMEEILILL